MYGVKRRACKHKMASGGDEKGTSSKKILLSNNTRLMKAIDNQNILAVKEFLENEGLKPSKSCLNDALLKAVEEGQKQVVQLLLSHNVYVSGKSKTGSLAIVAAAERGYLDIVKLLVKKGAPVDGKNASGKTPLMAAVEKSCCSALVSYLLYDCKADLNLQDNEGKTALMLAVEQWDYETVQLFFLGEDNEIHDCDELIKDSDGFTALDLAERNGSGELMNVLSQSRKKKISPLSLAAGMNNLDLVRLLVQMYPSCVETLDYGTSPLPAAVHGLDMGDDEWDGEIHCSLELMDFLLQAGVDVDDDYMCYLTPLMFAVSAGAEKAVNMLLWHGADVNRLSHESKGKELKRRTALMIASEKGFVSILEMLIEAGADLYKTNHEGENAMGVAIKGGHKACIQTFLKYWKVLKDEDVDLMEENRVLDVLMNVKDRWDELLGDPSQVHNIFCKAIQARCYQLVMALAHYGADINRWSLRTCPLFLALSDVNMLHLILDLGADINTRQTPTSYTALMQATLDGKVKPIHTLLNYGADMYAQSNGATALTLASLKHKNEVVIALLEEGVDVNHVTETQMTALWCALTAKNFAITEKLIKFGANVNFVGIHGATVLIHAIKHCTSNFSELILRNGADVNAQDGMGDTALFHALRHSITREEKVSLLLQHGANVNHVNLSTNTPLMVAARFCHAKILKVLLDSQPRVNVKDINGNTALHVAVQYSHHDCEEKVSALVGSGASLNMINADYESPLIIAVKNLDAKTTKCLLSHGANVDCKICPYASQMWRTDLDNLLRKYNTYRCNERDCIAFMNCMETLLEAGWSLHGIQSSNLDNFLGLCINGDRLKLVKLLIQSGVGPNHLELSCLPESFPVNFVIDAVTTCNSNVSPLCTAILIGRPRIIAFFAEACFYNHKDAKMLQNFQIKLKLEELFFDWPVQKFSSKPIDEICPKNWSLRTWSKLAVQKAVGFGPGREKRMRALPIPVGLQDELLFKNISINTNSTQEDTSNTAHNVNMGLDDRD